MRNNNLHIKEEGSLGTFFIFCAFVGILIIGSFSVKLFLLFRDSSFDGEHRFTLEIRHSERQIDIISFEPKSWDLGIYSFTSTKNIGSLKNKYGVPVDGVIKDSGGKVESGNILGKLYRYMFRVNSGTGVNSLDIARLIIFTYSVDRGEVEYVKVPIKNTFDSSLLSEAFFDKTVMDEGKTIAIVNAAAYPGLASRVERLLTSMGGNVVSVTTTPRTEKKSRIEYDGASSYTLGRVLDIAPYSVKEATEPGISDILIVIGEDRIDQEEE